MTVNKGIPRIIEITLAIAVLLPFLPVLLLCGLLIKLSSPGPALFKQKRVGAGGKEFILFKLRTMRTSSDGPKVTASRDSRITPVGKFLRKTKIDEVPGLWNIVNGDMSLVGPRPEVPELVDFSDSRWQKVFEMPPGLTDPVTLKLRNEEALMAQVAGDREDFYKRILQPFKLKGYIEYAERRTWKTDLSVLFHTIMVIFVPKLATAPTVKELEQDSNLKVYK